MAAEVVLRLAREGHAPHELARWPYVSALGACLAVVRADRDLALVRESEQLRGARLVNAAMADGPAYDAAVRDFEVRARGPVRLLDPDAGLAVLADAVRDGMFAAPAEG